MTEIKVGARAKDTEKDDVEDLIVILKPDASIEEWNVFGDETVADHNPEYSHEAPVAVCMHTETLDNSWKENPGEENHWRTYSADELWSQVLDRGHKFYSFPETRLEYIEDAELDLTDKEVEEYYTREIEVIASELEQAGYPVEIEDNNAVIDKFGTYVVNEDRELVESSGKLDDRIGAVLSDV